MADDELIEVLDNKRQKTGEIVKRCQLVALGKHYLSVNVWIVNSKGQFLIQKRVSTKKVDPNMWSVCGGLADCGETSLAASLRESKEEVGIELDENLATLVRQKETPDPWGSWVDVWLVRDNSNFCDFDIQKKEVSDVKWASVEEVNQLIEQDKFSKNVSFAFADVLLSLKAQNS